ncbi:AAA family ATPase, partial [Aeromonas caviae]|uniref:nucleotide-binding protein n=1 Tax=Aeromonas caviae TaxID=648 RepID=UPI003014EFF8
MLYSFTYLLIQWGGGIMLVVAVLNQKGGSGKTTIATHLSRAFQLMGRDVL